MGINTININDLSIMSVAEIENAVTELILVIPKTLGMKEMQSLVQLLRETVTVIHAGYNGIGLMYSVRARCCDVQALLDLGCIEWF
jgi:hypothetical protein